MYYNLSIYGTDLDQINISYGTCFLKSHNLPPLHPWVWQTLLISHNLFSHHATSSRVTQPLLKSHNLSRRYAISYKEQPTKISITTSTSASASSIEYKNHHKPETDRSSRQYNDQTQVQEAKIYVYHWLESPWRIQNIQTWEEKKFMKYNQTKSSETWLRAKL